MRFVVGPEGLWATLDVTFQFMDHRDRMSSMQYGFVSGDVSDLMLVEKDPDAFKEMAARGEREAVMGELKTQVLRLLELEMTEADILSAVRACMPSEVSKLVITPDYKIHVSRFHQAGNTDVDMCREIKMSPLDKAVYILFLRHPEGINFSYLPDYQDELMEIYKKVMNYRTTAAMQRSVEDVTDPTKNSINEKCARIRRAFVEAFGEYKAEPYYISGPRGDAKRITLDRTLWIGWRDNPRVKTLKN